MTFGKRITSDLEVIHSCDPALAGVDSTVMDSYLLSRDIGILPIDAVAGSTVFTVRPLGVESEHLVTLAHEPQAMRAIFRKHVCGCRGPMSSWIVFETQGGKRQVTEQSTEEVTLDVIAEIVTVIVQAASRRGDSAPFSPPDSWRQSRRLTARAKALAALIAPTDSTAQKDSPR